MSKRNSCVASPYPGVVDGHHAPDSHSLPLTHIVTYLKAGLNEVLTTVMNSIVSVVALMLELNLMKFIRNNISLKNGTLGFN